MTRAAVILAVGMGIAGMKSAKPKVMHPIAGLPILGHVIAAARGVGVERIVVVTSAQMVYGAFASSRKAQATTVRSRRS